MTQTAQVVALLDNKTARIRVERVSACGHDCSSCEGCGLQATPIEAIALNTVSAKPGDTVLIESGSKQVIGMAFFTYLLPLLLFFTCYFVALAFGVGEGLCGVLGAIGFCVGLLGAVLSNHRGQIPTSIIEIVEKGGSACSDM